MTRAQRATETAQGGEVDAQAVIARSMSERDLSQHVVNLARMLGWLVHRDPTWRATGADPGYPDLTLIRDGKVWFIELKTERGTVTDAQRRWGSHITVSGKLAPSRWRPSYRVYRPSDWLSGTIERVLRGEAE